MKILRCDLCGAEVLEISHFSITFHNASVKNNVFEQGGELFLNKDIELCHKCSSELFEKYNLEVKR